MKILRRSLRNLARLDAKQKVAVGIVAVILVSGGAYTLLNFNKCNQCVYNKNDIKVTIGEFNKAYGAKQNFYAYSNQSVDSEILKRDTLDELKMSKKIERYANSNKIKVSDQEINLLYQERVSQNKTEKQLLDKVKTMYGFTKDEYLQVLKNDLLRSKVEQYIDQPLGEWLNSPQ